MFCYSQWIVSQKQACIFHFCEGKKSVADPGLNQKNLPMFTWGNSQNWRKLNPFYALKREPHTKNGIHKGAGQVNTVWVNDWCGMFSKERQGKANFQGIFGKKLHDLFLDNLTITIANVLFWIISFGAFLAKSVGTSVWKFLINSCSRGQTVT